MKRKKGRNMLAGRKIKGSSNNNLRKTEPVKLRDTDSRGKMKRPYIVEDWALIYMANGCHMSNTAKVLKVTRSRLYAHLKSDEDLKDAFRDAELAEFDDIRAKLVKLCLQDEHFHAIKFYLESRGADFGFARVADESDEESEERAEMLESMTTADKAAAYELMLADDAEAIAKAKAKVK